MCSRLSAKVLAMSKAEDQVFGAAALFELHEEKLELRVRRSG
jgi:hypothetical protein